MSSPAFGDGHNIPAQHTADGHNTSPELHWSNAPQSTKSYALVCEDPDAPSGMWVHWVLFNVPADVHFLHPDVLPEHVLQNGARQGINDFHKVGYGGPAPPAGKPHRYFFKLYALDTVLELGDGVTRLRLLDAVKGHILAEAHLMGKYGR